jgi:hypothetical protein
MSGLTAITTGIPKRRRVLGTHPTKAKPDGGTPETATKLMPDHIKSLREDLHQAAIAIDAAYCIVCAKARSKASNYEPRTSPSKEGDLAPDSRKAKLLNAWWEWQKEMTARKLKIGPIMDMVVDGMPPWEVDRRRGWLPGLSANRLLEALELYCRVGR